MRKREAYLPNYQNRRAWLFATRVVLKMTFVLKLHSKFWSNLFAKTAPVDLTKTVIYSQKYLIIGARDTFQMPTNLRVVTSLTTYQETRSAQRCCIIIHTAYMN